MLWFLIYDGSVHHSVYVQWFWLIYQQNWPMADQQIEHRKPCSFLTVCFCILNWHRLVFAKSTLCCFRRGWTMWLTANSTWNLHTIICFDGGAKCFDIHIVFLKSSVNASSFQSSCDSNQFIIMPCSSFGVPILLSEISKLNCFNWVGIINLICSGRNCKWNPVDIFSGWCIWQEQPWWSHFIMAVFWVRQRFYESISW